MSVESSSEFESELEQERAKRLQRRFLLMVGVTLLFSLPGLLLLFVKVSGSDVKSGALQLRVGWSVTKLVLYISAAIVVIVTRRDARFTSLLAIALVSFIAVMSTPLERIVSSLEGTKDAAAIAAAFAEGASGPPPTRGVGHWDDQRGGPGRGPGQVDDGRRFSATQPGEMDARATRPGVGRMGETRPTTSMLTTRHAGGAGRSGGEFQRGGNPGGREPPAGGWEQPAGDGGSPSDGRGSPSDGRGSPSDGRGSREGGVAFSVGGSEVEISLPGVEIGSGPRSVGPGARGLESVGPGNGWPGPGGPGQGSPRGGGPRRSSQMETFITGVIEQLLTPSVRTAVFGLFSLMMAHAVACMFIPWTFRESLVPGLAGVVGYGGVVVADTLMQNLTPVSLVWGMLGVAAAVVPGSTLCWWRHSRYRADYRLQFESGRYRQLKDDLASARRVHESCLPTPLLTGPTRVAYLYRPMRDIGGDLLMCRPMGQEADAPVLIAVIDVTGHGIAAALTVNRLLGELDRIVAESPDMRPAHVMGALNRYVTLMLGSQGLYLSAAVFLLDPRKRTIAFANGGHPSAYLLRRGRVIEELESNSTLLGVLEPDDYDAAEQTLALEPGDVIVACTDGAIETRLGDDTLLMTAGLRQMVNEVGSVASIGPERMPEALHRRLDAVRVGGMNELEDDTLLIAMWLA